MQAEHANRTIQISLLWLIIMGFFIILLGMVGSLLAAQLLPQTTRTPLIKNLQPLVTNVQQVTVSPSSKGAEIVRTAEKSVVLLAEANGNTIKVNGTGLVITNDGLIVTTKTSANPTIAIDSEGHSNPIDKVGNDDLYGLQYYQLKNSIFSTLPLLDSDPLVASQFLLVSRATDSLQPQARMYFLSQYITSPLDIPMGISRLGQGTAFADSNVLAGSPVMTDDGKIAGLLVDPEKGFVIPSTALQRSLNRAANNKRELDPFSDLGFTVRYGYTALPTNPLPTFSVTVLTVKPGTVASNAGLKAGDIVTKVGSTTLLSDSGLADLLTQSFPLAVSILHQGQPQTLTFDTVVASPSPLPSIKQ